MLLRCAAMLCALCCAFDVLACSLSSGIQPFAASAAAGNQDGGEALAMPRAEVVSVTRGIAARAGSCDEAGLLSVRVTWPRGNDYKPRDLGFEFRVVSGDSRYPIFPEGPVSGRVEGRASEFLFIWADGSPQQQQAIELQVEVRAVTPDNRRGPPARFSVQAAPGA